MIVYAYFASEYFFTHLLNLNCVHIIPIIRICLSHTRCLSSSLTHNKNYVSYFVLINK